MPSLLSSQYTKPLIDAVALLAQALYFGISQFVQDAAAVALGDATIPPTVSARFHERRDALVAALRAEAGLEFSPPAGGMFLLVDVSATGLSGEAFAAGLLEAEGVEVFDGRLVVLLAQGGDLVGHLGEVDEHGGIEVGGEFRDLAQVAQALELGAVDYITKPKLDVAHGLQAYADELIGNLDASVAAINRLPALDRKSVV